MPVDLYVGGAEHAVLHLLYARFWHKVLFDRGVVSTPEPFRKLVNQGMILGEMEFTGYQVERASGSVRPTWQQRGTGRSCDQRRRPDTGRAGAGRGHRRGERGRRFRAQGRPPIRLDSRAYKMSKSRGNVVNPDEVVREYGADSLRLYEMFMGPLEATKPWSMEGVSGVRGFLDRVWRLIVDERAESAPAACRRSQDIAADRRAEPRTAPDDQEGHHATSPMAFNTAIARMMEFTNFFTKQSTGRPR